MELFPIFTLLLSLALSSTCSLIPAAVETRISDAVKSVEKFQEKTIRKLVKTHASDFVPLLSQDTLRRPYESSDYCYEDDENCGPKNWKGSCRKGKRQSPINIVTKDVVKGDTKGENPLEFSSSYKEDVEDFLIGNHGQSIVVQVQAYDKSKLSLRVADLNLKYQFAHIHFHWGAENERGSEHTVDGVAFPMEIHFVHYDNKYDDLEHALAEGEDTAVNIIAVFVKVGEENKELDRIVDAVDDVAKSKTSGYNRVEHRINIYDILPSHDEFLRYKGSLSVPKCHENVIYHVMKKPIEISKKQLQVFRNIKSSRTQKMSDNFRPVQPLNGRQVTCFSYKSK